MGLSHRLDWLCRNHSTLVVMSPGGRGGFS
jgi:hypothetical protein